jgi:cation diffusion facilitator CzcD-associated flavoprotein CzcO
MVARKKVCVIGAGISGLAAAKAFGAKGHDVAIVEKSADFGGVWEPARSYPDVQTQSPKDLYRYTDHAMPDNFPEWPKGPQVHAYLVDHARRHGLTQRTRFKLGVERMERREDGKPGWNLRLRSGDGVESIETYDFVAACTGQFNDKNMPSHPGQVAFAVAGGTVLHSSEYTDFRLIVGKRIVVLGGSKSATDIAVNAARSGAASVTLVYREPVWRVPYFIGGLINFKRILYARAQEQMFPGWNPSAASRFKHAIAKPFVWANWRALESLLKLQFNLKKVGMTPERPIESAINCSIPIATPGFYPMVADGRIKAIRGTFDRYEPGAILLSGGERLEADVAILAVGWKLGAPYLDERDRAKLIEPDGQFRLYRLIVNPDLPDMGFVGFNSSFASVLTSEIGAEWLVRYADGQLARQPSAAEMRRDIDMMLHWRRVERPSAAVYGGLCVAPFHFKHLDELIADMGAAITRRNPIAERLLPPDADAFAKYLASAPAYAAE